MRRLAILALLCAAPVAAQPSRYPKPPVDEDRAREQRSSLWDAATHPAKAPYAAAIDEASRKLQVNDFAGAEDLATRAIALLPALPQAYVVRGQARYGGRANWAGCAEDLAAAIAHAHDDKLSDHLYDHIYEHLGACQARAGQLADAEATLADAAALSPHDRELWIQLGDVRVAMGKLDEAVAAFDTAIAEGSTAAVTYWHRAGAFDRARQPSKAEDDVRTAMTTDRSMNQIDSGVLPPLGAGEREFLFGVAKQYAEQVDVESALVHFREFLAVAPASPWRRRAEEHLRELTAMPLPTTVLRTSGNAPLDLDATTKIVRAAMPRMRACLAKLPATMIEVRITRTGPMAPIPLHVRYRAPPAGVQLNPSLELDQRPTEVDAAQRCLEPIADKLPLPPIKDKETYYQFMFSVVAP